MVAVVSAVGALVVAIISAILSGLTARRQMLLRNRLDREARAEDARQAYEYDARKRLYRECEPLLFQARELANEARGRITGLAIAARNGDIGEDGDGWLAKPGYYTLSTCYSLVAPASIYLLLQRRLTDFDLGLEPRIQAQYEVLKLLYASVSDDFGLAQAVGLDYHPDDADPGQRDREKLRADQPEIYWRQGLYRGTMSLVGDAFIAKEEEARRCKTFSEFYVEAQDRQSSIGRVLPELLDLVQRFHPARRPVLWLVMVEQLMLYDVLRQCGKLEPGDEVATLMPASARDYATDLSWRRGLGSAADEHERDVIMLGCVQDRVVSRTRPLLIGLTGPRRS
jgi:heme exporter protein D